MLALIPRCAESEQRAPAGEDVERRHDLRQEPGVAVADARDENAERHRLRAARDIAESRIPLEHRLLGACELLHLEVVVHAGEHRAAGGFRRLRRVAHMRPQRHRAARECLVEKVDPDLHHAQPTESRSPCSRLTSTIRKALVASSMFGWWQMIRATLFNDAGCPWGYSANPAFRVLEWRYGDQIEWRLVVIGLRGEGSEQMERQVDPAGGTRLIAFRNRTARPCSL